MLSFRRALASDVDTYYRWVNDPSVRQNSLNQDMIPYEVHRKWFADRLNSDLSILLLFEVSTNPVGQVRIDIVDGEGEIDISVDLESRGLGYAGKILSASANYFFHSTDHKLLKAQVLKSNLASSATFLKCGFVEELVQTPDPEINYFIRERLR